MSAPYADIRAALADHLDTFATAYPIAVAWENTRYTPTPGSPYIKPELLPGEPMQAELGQHGRNLHVGVYHLSLFYPAGTGTLGAGTARDDIIDHFKRGTVLEYGGLPVTVTKAHAGPMLQETDWVNIPITIQYRVFADN